MDRREIYSAIQSNPDYRVFWRAGFAYRGAGETEVTRETSEEMCYPYFDARGRLHLSRIMTFDEKLGRKFSWAAHLQMTIDHTAKEIHINGYSANDMY